MKNVICMQIIKSHEKLHKPLAELLENEQTVEGQSSGCSQEPKNRKKKWKQGWELYLLRKMVTTSSFDSISPGQIKIVLATN